MSLDVRRLAQQLRRSESELRAQLTAPVLVQVVDAQPGEVLVFTTRTVQTVSPGMSTRPTAWLLCKDTVKPNPFTMGITVGRVAGNDVVLAHSSISRLHAYFVPGKRGQWRLFDANSKNGTWVGERRLPPNIPSAPTEGEPVPDGATLRLGDLLLRFFQPDSFVDYLRGLRQDGPDML